MNRPDARAFAVSTVRRCYDLVTQVMLRSGEATDDLRRLETPAQALAEASEFFGSALNRDDPVVAHFAESSADCVDICEFWSVTWAEIGQRPS